MSPDPEIHRLTDVVRVWAARTPDAPAVCDERRSVSFAELDRQTNRVAQAIVAGGVGRGGHLGFLGKNGVEFYECWFGAMKAGCALAPLNWRCPGPELIELVEDAACPVLVVAAEFSEVAREVATRVPHDVRVVVIDGTPGDGDYDGWLDGHHASDPRRDEAGAATALLTYTSGTTGVPKGAQWSHDNFERYFHAASIEPVEGWTDTDVALMVMPNFHLAGSWVTLPALYHGRPLVTLPVFEPTSFAEAVRRHQVTMTCLVPTAIQLVLEHPTAAAADLSSLRRLLYAGSPIAASTMIRAREVLGCDLIQFYGATETYIITMLRPDQHDPADLALLASCGATVPMVQTRIVDAEGQDVPDGVVGQVLVRSPYLFSGYWNRPEDTAAVLIDGWYHTGDLGRREPDGLHYLVDRAKDMIVTGGENVYSVEVERAIARHPAVATVAVIGLPDPRWGERVTAFVVARPDTTVTPDELITHCRTVIAGYKVPKAVHLVENLPTTASGKIQKAALRAHAANPAVG